MAKKKFPIVVAGPGVAAYSYVNEPDTKGVYADNKYKVTMLLDNDVDLTGAIAKCHAAAELEWGKVPEDLKLPFADGNEKRDKDGNPKTDYADKIVFTAKSKFAPSMVDAKRAELPDTVWPMSGDVVKVSFACFPYVKTETEVEKINGKKVKREVQVYGVSAQLRAVQLLEKRSGFGNSGNDFDVEDDYDGVEAPATKDSANGDDDVDDF